MGKDTNLFLGQLVVRGSEWDGKSGAKVEGSLDGKGGFLVVVEWDVLVFAVHATGLDKHVGTR